MDRSEILKHLASTVYSNGARKSILGYLKGIGIDAEDVTFAPRRCSANAAKAATFTDFLVWLTVNNAAANFDALREVSSSMFKSTFKIGDIFDKGVTNYVFDAPQDTNFSIGDAVKYITGDDEYEVEYVEALAQDNEGNIFLCLSNGKYVRPECCAKYKIQGDERRALLDKLSETL